MEKKQTKKLTVDFPINEFIYLKMACAKQDVSIKDFVTKAIIRSIEDYEDEIDRESIKIARQSIETQGSIPWEEMERKLGWDKL